MFDAEDAAELTHEALSSVSPEKWPGLRFVAIPALMRLRLAWPVTTIWRRVDEPSPPQGAFDVEPHPIQLVVWRREERVRHRLLDAIEAHALEALCEGRDFASICETIARDIGDEAAPERAAGYLARWQADGLLTRISDDTRPISDDTRPISDDTRPK